MWQGKKVERMVEFTNAVGDGGANRDQREQSASWRRLELRQFSRRHGPALIQPSRISAPKESRYKRSKQARNVMKTQLLTVAVFLASTLSNSAFANGSEKIGPAVEPCAVSVQRDSI